VRISHTGCRTEEGCFGGSGVVSGAFGTGRSASLDSALGEAPLIWEVDLLLLYARPERNGAI
jgi:hypothetical protein